MFQLFFVTFFFLRKITWGTLQETVKNEVFSKVNLTRKNNVIHREYASRSYF